MPPKPLPFSLSDLNRAADELAHGGLLNLDAELSKRNVLPLIGEQRLLVVAIMTNVSLLMAHYIVRTQADGHSMQSILDNFETKKEPPPSPL